MQCRLLGHWLAARRDSNGTVNWATGSSIDKTEKGVVYWITISPLEETQNGTVYWVTGLLIDETQKRCRLSDHWLAARRDLKRYRLLGYQLTV